MSPRNTLLRQCLLLLLQLWHEHHPKRPVSLTDLAHDLGISRQRIKVLYDELTAKHKLPLVDKRGFASMDPEKRRRIVSLGGKTVQMNGRGHSFTAEEARRAGQISKRKRVKISPR